MASQKALKVNGCHAQGNTVTYTFLIKALKLYGQKNLIQRQNGEQMPTYDFKCEECETTFELSLSFDNKDMQYCEDCEKPLVRIYAPVAAIFRGTGWGSSK